MQIQVSPKQTTSISAYEQHSVTINQQQYKSSILISNHQVLSVDKTIQDLPLLTLKDLPLSTELNLLLIGGDKLSPLDVNPKFQHELYQQNIALEVMPLGSACRTFNVLISESRACACLILFN